MKNNFYRIKTLAEMFSVLNLPSPKHPLIAILDYSDAPLTTTIPKQKIICDFYQISFKSDSNGYIKYGRETYDYQDGSLVYVAPDQAVEYANSDDLEIDKGWTLCFHADLIRGFSLDEKMKDYHFFGYQSNEALHVSEKEKEIIKSILEKIQIELDSNIDEYSEEVIVTNLELLLNYSKRFYNRQFITRKRFDKDIVIEFTDLLEKYYAKGLQHEKGVPNVSLFADELNYSPNYFNELIKKSTGKSVLEHIHYSVIGLAKSHLLNSNKSVSEIAYELGFEYSQYFSRLFKKKTGMTPVEYRKVS